MTATTTTTKTTVGEAGRRETAINCAQGCDDSFGEWDHGLRPHGHTIGAE